MANIPEIDPQDRMMDYDDAPRGGGGKPRWGRRILTALVAFAALGGFAMVVVYSLDQGGGEGGQTVAPIVKALDGPTKVKPAEPGGMKIPDQDKQVFSRLDPNAPKKTVERLLPPPKRVLDSPPPSRQGAELELSPAPVLAPPPVPKPPPVAAAAPSASVTPPPAPPSPPKMAVEAPAPAAPESASQAESAAAHAATAAAQVAPAAGGFRVQLVALRSEQAARTAWAGYVKQHGDLFGKLTPTVAKAEIKGKGTFYRLQAGPLADDATARALCAKIKKRKIGCLVVKP